MIQLETECSRCFHEKMCKWKGKAEDAMKNLNTMKYDENYTWKEEMNKNSITLTFTCDDFDWNGQGAVKSSSSNDAMIL